MANTIEVLGAITFKNRAVFDLAGQNILEAAAEYLVVAVPNKNTRLAYGRAIGLFLAWIVQHKLPREQWTPPMIRAYLEHLAEEKTTASVKQHLAGLRGWFDWMVVKGLWPFNPAQPVRGPKLSITRGSTPYLTLAQVRDLLGVLNVPTVRAARDRAIIGTMLFTFARVDSVCQLTRQDYFLAGHKPMLRLHVKGGMILTVPVHHCLVDWLEIYLRWYPPKCPQCAVHLFSPVKHHSRSDKFSLVPRDVNRIVKHWCAKAGLPPEISCHSFRASGITAYLAAGGSLEMAAQIAGHASTRTTQLYDRRGDAITLSEIERIRF